MIHVFQREGEWEVWSDQDEEEGTGRCLGISRSIDEALDQAYHEASEELKQITNRIEDLRQGDQP